MTEIILKVTDQHLRAIVQPLIASGGKNENRITVQFEGHEWDGYVSLVAFNTDLDPDTIYTQNLDANNQCIVPWEVTEKACTLWVAVAGTASSDVKRTTEVCAIEIVNGAGNGNAIPDPPTPTVYDNLIALINTKQDLLVSGTNIKTINGNSLLGSGNISILPQGIYPCTTASTFSDIYSAYYTSKLLPVFDDGNGNKYYPVDLAQSSPNSIQFASVKENSSGIQIYIEIVDTSNVWTGSSFGYVQEKLVSGTNIKTINNNSILGSGDLPISGGSELYECTFASDGSGTTQTDIAQALNDGKLPYVEYGGYYYYYITYSSSRYYFVSPGSNQIRRVTCPSNNHWGTANITCETTSNKVTAWQATPDDTHYPSEKLVKDSIDAITTSGFAEFHVTLTTANYQTGIYEETVSGIDAYSKFFVIPDPQYKFGKYYASDMSFAIVGSNFRALTDSYQGVDLHIVIYAYN